MSEPFIGEIRMFGGNFAPRGWAFCDGQLLPIDQNPALFSLLGTNYGGDGRTTFALPDLRGRAPIHAGNGPGLSPRVLGQAGGAESVTLNTQHLPSHAHDLLATQAPATEAAPHDGVFALAETDRYHQGEADARLSPALSAGGGQVHSNLQPQLAVSFIIALVGIYPSRN
ncbi:tail fiber protein [Myxococcota bacterium]|nr:tail fiber protein [Myxococcota bacterium]MBU1431757.1 tail fiber protein [Myxococcota bacterium]MBU1897452.1 tail fiber protein [Myxococcota bacterium]